MASTRALGRLLNSLTSAMADVPPVNVPVLSSTTVSIRASRSMASLRVTSRPARESRNMAAASAAGVASDNAQGHVITSTASTAENARSGATMSHSPPVRDASTSMASTNHDAARSATCAMCGRVDWARSSNATIAASEESFTAARAVMVSASPDIYLRRVSAQLGFDALICTEMEVEGEGDNARLTGRMKTPNCHGGQKVVRLRAWAAERFGAAGLEGATLYAYGDTSGDKPMLRLARHAWYRGEPWVGE